MCCGVVVCEYMLGTLVKYLARVENRNGSKLLIHRDHTRRDLSLTELGGAGLVERRRNGAPMQARAASAEGRPAQARPGRDRPAADGAAGSWARPTRARTAPFTRAAAAAVSGARVYIRVDANAARHRRRRATAEKR